MYPNKISYCEKINVETAQNVHGSPVTRWPLFNTYCTGMFCGPM